jgi:4-amino-4-deoxy-L-arabinose transferase-like glycosyltransferase
LQRIRRLICSEWFLLLAITALAGVLRFYALDRLPAGLYHDEAYNGLDALAVLRGVRPIFFEANNGREPFFIYLVTLSVWLLGRSPLAIRIVSALLGTLTVPAAYAMARELLGRREATLTALVTALTFWHLNLSRIGLRAVSLPLWIALSLWLFARALHRRRGIDYTLAGACLGISIYTYIAARFLPIAFLLLCVYWLVRRQPLHARGLLLFFATALLVAAPLLIYFAAHLSTFLERSSQVSIFNPAINGGDLAGTLLRHLGKTLAMFNWRGDFIPRHNLPLRPVFDPIMGIFFLLGLVISGLRARQRPEYGLLLIACLVMLVPTVLAEDAPHFLRSVGILPTLFVFPAIGLAALWDLVQPRASRTAAVLAVALIAACSGYTTVSDYFLHHVQSEALYYNLEAGAVELSADVNRFLGGGWQGTTGLRVATQSSNSRRCVYLDERLWRDWPSLRYLLPERPNLVLLGQNVPPLATADREASPERSVGDEVQVIVWPFADHSQYLSLLPTGHVISVHEGLLERGDLEKEARLLCLTYEAAPATQVPTNLRARFEEGIELLGYELLPAGQGTRLRLFWRAGAALQTDYSVFVHVLRGGQQVTQNDSYPAQGHYPTHLWRSGDIVVDDHLLNTSLPGGQGDSLAIGLYQWQTLQRLLVLSVRGQQVSADAVTVTVP